MTRMVRVKFEYVDYVLPQVQAFFTEMHIRELFRWQPPASLD